MFLEIKDEIDMFIENGDAFASLPYPLKQLKNATDGDHEDDDTHGKSYGVFENWFRQFMACSGVDQRKHDDQRNCVDNIREIHR